MLKVTIQNLKKRKTRGLKIFGMDFNTYCTGWSRNEFHWM